MSLRRLIAMATVSLAAVSVLAVPAMADEDSGAKRCLPLSNISSIKVVDNQHLRFDMRGGPDYMNTLPNKCPGLSKHTPIMYKTSLSQLCDLDTVTVLQTVGGGFMRGATCGLGKFEPMDKDGSDMKD